MKVNCRRCDICVEEMGARDLQYWFRKPIIKWGVPVAGMSRLDICDKCFAKISVMIQHPELIKDFGGDEE